MNVRKTIPGNDGIYFITFTGAGWLSGCLKYAMLRERLLPGNELYGTAGYKFDRMALHSAECLQHTWHGLGSAEKEWVYPIIKALTSNW